MRLVYSKSSFVPASHKIIEYSIVNKSGMLEHTLFGMNHLEFINRKKRTSANMKSVMDNVLPIFIDLGGKLKLLSALSGAI